MARVYGGLEELTYPFHDATFTVTHCGRICFHGRKINVSHVFVGQNVGVTGVGDRLWLMTFMQHDSAGADRETIRPESVTYVLGMNRHPFDRKIPRRVVGATGFVPSRS